MNRRYAPTHLSDKKLQKETLCEIQLSSPIFFVHQRSCYFNYPRRSSMSHQGDINIYMKIDSYPGELDFEAVQDKVAQENSKEIMLTKSVSEKFALNSAKVRVKMEPVKLNKLCGRGGKKLGDIPDIKKKDVH